MNPNPSATPDATPPVVITKPSKAPSMWKWLLALVVLFVVLAWLTAPMVIRCPKRSEQTQAVNNARQIGIALFEFEAEYGKMPDASTIEAVRKATESRLYLGTRSSNDFFRQLLASGIAGNEAMFYAEISGTHKPDGDITGNSAVAKGECGFTYFLGEPEKCNRSRPLLITPMIPGTDRFDPKPFSSSKGMAAMLKPFDGKAVMLRMDHSVISLPIDKDGHVILDGQNLMDPSHPVWEGKPPWIAWPE